MTLVDTSIWVRFLQKREPYHTELKTLLSQEQVIGHPLVFGELLIGDSGGRTRVLDDYARMEHARAVAHEELVTLVRTRRLFGRGIGWIDVHLLASAILCRATFWTADQALEEVASEFGIVYVPPEPGLLKARHNK
jgi:hypothetical protein